MSWEDLVRQERIRKKASLLFTYNERNTLLKLYVQRKKHPLGIARTTKETPVWNDTYLISVFRMLSATCCRWISQEDSNMTTCTYIFKRWRYLYMDRNLRSIYLVCVARDGCPLIQLIFVLFIRALSEST